MPSRIIAPETLYSRRDFMIVNTDDDHEGQPQMQVPIAGVEEILFDYYTEGCFTDAENAAHMHALWHYHHTGEIGRTLYQLPRGMFHPYWRVIEQSGQHVLFHILVEACFQEAYVPPPINLFGEGILDAAEDMETQNSEVRQSFIHFVSDMAEELMDEDYTAGAA